jgi:hypothetical protein
MFRFVRLGLVALGAAVALIATPVAAGAQPPVVNETTTVKNVTETFVDVVPTCEENAPAAEITITYNAIEHVTVFENGTVHATFTQTGTFVATVIDTGATATGTFTIWGGFNQNNQSVNGTFTFSVRGAFEDGTRINVHFVDHFNVTPTGAEFFFTKCHD